MTRRSSFAPHRRGVPHDERLLDKIGVLILRELQHDARLSSAELGRRVGLSPPATAERVRKMEEAGLIVGYRASLDPGRLGFTVAFLRVTTSGTGRTRALALVADLPEVVECHRTTGDDVLLMKVIVPDLPSLERIIDRISDLGSVTSSTVLSTLVASRAVPLDPKGRP